MGNRVYSVVRSVIVELAFNTPNMPPHIKVGMMIEDDPPRPIDMSMLSADEARLLADYLRDAAQRMDDEEKRRGLIAK